MDLIFHFLIVFPASYGPVNSKHHFCVPRQALVERCLHQLVGQPEDGGHYFTIWAARQAGKTWLMQQMKQQVTQLYGDLFTVYFCSFSAMRGMDYVPEGEGPDNPTFVLQRCFGNRITKSSSSGNLARLC